MVEARALHVLVSSDHHSADEQVAEAIARVLSRYAVDLGPEVRLKVSHDGVEVPYTARPAMSLASLVRQARTARLASRS
jgi:predicted dinucleotide-binding enzyme